MKKRVILTVILVVVGLAAGLLWFLTRPLPLSMEQIVPAQALMYVRFSHVAGDMDRLLQSGFWKNISTIDYPKVLEHNDASPSDIKNLRGLQQEMEGVLKNPLTKRFFSEEIAMGFYQNSTGKEATRSYDILLATRLGVTFQMVELFASMARQWSDGITTSTETYRGFTITHVHFKKKQLEFQYIRIHDVLLACLVPSDLLHQGLDVYLKARPSLAADPDFAQAMLRAYPAGHGIFYANVRNFDELLSGHLPAGEKENFEQIYSAAGFKSYVISFLPGDIFKMKLMMRFDTSQVKSSWRSMFSCPDAANPSLKFVPHNVVIYQWGECYNFKDLWSQFKEGIQVADAQQWKHRLEKRFKFNFEDDVLPILGSQVGGYLNDVDTRGLFPYPRGVFFIKVENRQAAEDLMKKLTANPLSLVQEENYQQASIHYITLNWGANMDLAYTFLGDYLLLATSRQLLKTSIDAFNDPNQSLQSNDTLKQFNIHASTLTHGMAFIKMDDLVDRLKQLLAWYNKVASSQITMASAYQQEAIKNGKELKSAIVSRQEDLRLAQDKFKQLQLKVTDKNLSDQEQADETANLDRLEQENKLLEEDLASYQKQQQDLQQLLMNYQHQAESAKRWLFNSDEVVMPLLKSLEGVQALGMQLHLSDNTSEMEIFIQ